MPTKHCCNQTTKSVKSFVFPWVTERMLDESGNVVAFVVNNPNYLNYINEVGTPIVYHGFDHLPCGTAQVSTPV